MKQIVTLLVLTASVGTVPAQSFSVSQSSAVVNGSFTDNEFYTGIKVYNNTSSNLMVRWVRTQQIMPPTWRTSVCNDYYCFGMYTDSAAFTMLPGDSDMVQIHFYPANTPGNAIIPVRLYTVNDPSDSLTITFYANAPVGIKEQHAEGFSIYPNPVTDKLRLTFSIPVMELDIEIYNALGQRVKNERVSNVQHSVQVDVDQLLPGYYFMRVEERDGAVTVKGFMKD